MSGIGSATLQRAIPRAGLALALVVLGQAVLHPERAAAAGTVTYTVSSTADIGATAGACAAGSTTTVAPSPLSLREATCLANNNGASSPVVINVPPGNYLLVNGELGVGSVSGSNITITGAGSASTVISGNTSSRVFDLDFNLLGGVTNSISGLTAINGRAPDSGGGAIIGGSNHNTSADVLTMNNVVVSNSTTVGADNSNSDHPGGGLQFFGGSLTIANSAFSGNSSGNSYGSGVAYAANGTVAAEALSVSGSTFSGNTLTNSTGNTGVPNGGALSLSGTAGSTAVVSESRFVNNSVTASTGSGAANGAAIWEQSGNLTVTETNFTGNSVSGGSVTDTGGAVEVSNSSQATLHYNRFVGNIAPSGAAVHALTATVNATDNWWGCNSGPGSGGCDTTVGAVTASPRLVLRASAVPSTVTGPNATSTITADLSSDSLGATVGGTNLDVFDALPATFSDPPGDATVTTTSGSHAAAFGTASGKASIDYHSNTTTGPDPVNVTFDNQTVTATPTVNQVPVITSPNTANFNIGTAGSFTVTTTGYPVPAITSADTAPAGLTFVDNGDGTATLSGTPSGPGGTFTLHLTANNGVAPNATQTLTVSIGQPPAFTSPSTATFTVGSAGSFAVTTSGNPTVTAITESGTLPAGVTFTDHADGTATLSGTPAAGSGSTYLVTLTATNGVTPNASQTLSIQVNQAPAVTSNPSDQTVNPGTSVTFTAAASGAPTPTVQWQRSTNGGASYTNIAGATSTSYTFTAVAGDDGNLYRAVFTNVVSTATSTAATLNVGIAPAFTSSNTTTFAVGTAGTFAITTSGVPSATLSHLTTGFPAWLTLNDNGDGTGSLTGTPPAGSGGTYTFTLKAANGFSPSASQIFTLNVDESPTITSTDHATFTVGSAGNFAVTTTAGFPTTTGITSTGPRPSGVSFTDNGDGTATLAGTPAPGSAGTYLLTIKATAMGGVTAPSTQSFVLTVNGPPTITSADHATFSVGAPGTFTVTTTAGFPTARSITCPGTLPSGVSCTGNTDGTATITGTPAFGSGGVYTLMIKASNGIAPDATQTFTLTVNQPPVITSTNHATFTVGAAAALTITTAPGQPAATTITQTGALPPGISFTDSGDGSGTATLSGTPTTGGTYGLTIKASNGVAPDPTQTLTITVNEPPSITSADHATFTVGTAGSFTLTTAPGTPSTTSVTERGALPDGVTFTRGAGGTAALSGTPAAGQGGVYPLTFTASNGVAPNPTQSFTLTVLEAPVITSTDHVTFTLGAAASFTVTTAHSYPQPLLSESGPLPAGMTFLDNGDGTATLSGTPTAGGVYPFTITANNGVAPTPSQSFTATVNQSPSITSADHATFEVGVNGSFTVTTTPGTPNLTSLTEDGVLPPGVSFTDIGNGTATITGTPAAGKGRSYAITITASNGVLPDTTQSFTLTVTELPTITSADHTAFVVGTAGSFSITTLKGYPTATTVSEGGPLPGQAGLLPAGVSFTVTGDGTATLSGTPAAGSGGSYPITLTATNTAGHTDQSFVLTVNESSAITSADSTTFTAGTPGTFTVTTAGGFPTPPTLSETGDLPDGVTFTANPDGTATLSGTPTAGGVYPLTITSSNGASTDARQSFTLTVNGPPSITSADAMTFTAGVAGTFTVTTRAGVPATPITLSETGALPAGVKFVDNGDGTATLAGTAPVSAIGNYPLIITASNTVLPNATQSFTLKIERARALTLPGSAPATNGPLHGVPPVSVAGTLLHVSGTGFAAGAPITVGVYSTPTTLANVTVNASGTFTATIRIPAAMRGSHVFIAAGVGANGASRYLEAGSLVVAPPAGGTGGGSGNGGSGTGGSGTGGSGSGTSGNGGSLANTGPDTDPRTTAGFALAAMLAGLMLLGASRRRRRGES